MKPRTPHCKLLLTALVAAGAAACADAPTGPAALVVAMETEAALRVAGSLPTLPELAGRLVDAGRMDETSAAVLLRARSLWADAEVAADETDAAALRRTAYGTAAPVLAEVLGPAELAEAKAALDRWVGLAAAAVGGADLPEVTVALTDGLALLAEADAASRAGRREEVVMRLLEAADRLRQTTPPAVARRLILQAERGLERRRSGEAVAGAAHDVAIDRADRLVHGARKALEAGDYVRAIRRAYYAGQLLDIR